MLQFGERPIFMAYNAVMSNFTHISPDMYETTIYVKHLEFQSGPEWRQLTEKVHPGAAPAGRLKNLPNGDNGPTPAALSSRPGEGLARLDA